MGVVCLWVVFDCYGTLVDWVYGLKSVLGYITGDEDSLRYFFDCERKAIREFRPYGLVLRDCLRSVLERYGVEYRDEYGEALAMGFAKSPLFPDTVPGLLALRRRGFKVAVLSNTEKKLIGITLSGLEGLFDAVITAEDVGAYKPSLEAFRRAYGVLGVEPGGVVHVSAYPYYDLEPARRLGARTVLVNRYGYSWPTSVKSLEEAASLIAERFSG